MPAAQAFPCAMAQPRHEFARDIGAKNSQRDDAMKLSATFRSAHEKIFHRRGARTMHGRKIASRGANQCR
jgi:hypothetical protein